jgi:hypothetical protein
MNASEIFAPENLIFIVPVVGAAVILMPLLYTGISNALVPYNELSEDSDYAKAWAQREHDRIQARRNEERRAFAREAWRQGDPNAPKLIGRRRSDYEALGIPYPGDE